MPFQRRTLWFDLAALVVITVATVALVVLGNAGAAVLFAASGMIATTFRIWRRP
ncbi:hypothetical protein [Nocardia arthritidis]|uniref:Uncharacterized protein n=1 Tax=Nocardia arthritidis TaxID=228602 RepID=A0A6G9YF84_9NOCA|nr:hypothetical protein [Nocardia arthritidis]QIS11848.1 hypothetical protein F5544_19900 [Nocardia arthritidis]